MNSKYEELKRQTNNVTSIWKELRGFAPASVADKMDGAKLRWMSELTDTLGIWMNKGTAMTDGELILARTNMGTLVESWLKFFYCVYYEDYIQQPKMIKSRKRGNVVIEPEKMSFETLKQFGIGILWEDQENSMYKWVDKIQRYRNAIHAFQDRDIGSPQGFMDDIESLHVFVESIISRLPLIEDFHESYPAEYIFD